MVTISRFQHYALKYWRRSIVIVMHKMSQVSNSIPVDANLWCCRIRKYSPVAACDCCAIGSCRFRKPGSNTDRQPTAQSVNMTLALARCLYSIGLRATELITSDKEEVNVFARVCLSVCMLARLLKTRAWIWMKCCVSTDVGTWTNWLTFESDPDYSPDAGTGLLSPISYKRCYAEFYVGKIPRIGLRIGGLPLQRGVVLKIMVLFTEPSDHLCRRYMRSTECPSTYIKRQQQYDSPADLNPTDGTVNILGNFGSDTGMNIIPIPPHSHCLIPITIPTPIPVALVPISIPLVPTRRFPLRNWTFFVFFCTIVHVGLV